MIPEVKTINIIEIYLHISKRYEEDLKQLKIQGGISWIMELEMR